MQFDNSIISDSKQTEMKFLSVLESTQELKQSSFDEFAEIHVEQLEQPPEAEDLQVPTAAAV